METFLLAISLVRHREITPVFRNRAPEAAELTNTLTVPDAARVSQNAVQLMREEGLFARTRPSP